MKELAELLGCEAGELEHRQFQVDGYISSAGQILSNFTVPSGKTLIVTGADFLSHLTDSAGIPILGTMAPFSYLHRLQLVFQSSGKQQQITGTRYNFFKKCLVPIPPGKLTVKLTIHASAGTQSIYISASFHGYLVPTTRAQRAMQARSQSLASA